MADASLPASSDKLLEVLLTVCDKWHYRVDIDSATQVRVSKLFYYFEYSAGWRCTRLDYSSYLLITRSDRPYQKAVVPILPMELKVTLNHCRFGKHVVRYIVFLQNLHTSSR